MFPFPLGRCGPPSNTGLYAPTSPRRNGISIGSSVLYGSHSQSSPADTNTHPFNGPFSWTTQVSQYQKSKTNLDFTEAKKIVSGSGISWTICKSAPRSRQITMPIANPPQLSFLQAGCSSCHPTNSVKALKATQTNLWQK